MRILILGWELPPHNSGGLGVACYQLAKHLAVEGVEIDFVVPYKADHSEITFMRVHAATPHTPRELQIATAGAYGSNRYFDQEADSDFGGASGLRWQQRRYTEFVKQLVKREHYDVIHAHDWLTYEAGMEARKITQRPLIAHVHATEFDRAGGESGNPLVHEIEYAGLLMADRIMAVSQATKNILVQRYDIPADKIEVVHNSIDTSEFSDLVANQTYQYLNHMKRKGYTVVVSVGRLTIQKGLKFLLEAVALAVRQNPKILLVIAGSGELYAELIEQAAELGIGENVMFTGFVRGVAWRDVYAVADMFVMPSISEPFGLVALEAAGYGSAVLVSKQSGVAEVLHHVLRFDFWDTHLLASQIAALSESSALQLELTHNMQHEFSNLSWRRAAEICVHNYRQLAATAATAGIAGGAA
jgi:glycosyltransferase involved in cell wall biosynthesis